MEREKAELLKKKEILEGEMRTKMDETEAARDEINRLVAQLNEKDQIIIQLEQDISSMKEKVQRYSAEIETYKNHMEEISTWMKSKEGPKKELEQNLDDTKREVQKQQEALVRTMQELEALKKKTQQSIQEEKNSLREKREEMEQIMNEKDKKLQEAEKNIKGLTIALATFNRNKRKYQESIAESNNLQKCLQERQKELTNVRDAEAKKDQTISQLREQIERIKEDRAREINLPVEKVSKLNSHISQERKGDSEVTGKPLPPSVIKPKLKLGENTTEPSEIEDKSFIFLGKLDVALRELERWTESSNGVVESQKRIDNVYSTLESLASKLEQVLRTHQQNVCDGKVNCAYLQLNPDTQAPEDGILTRLETKVEDLKRSINEQHICSLGNVETNKLCYSVEEKDRLISHVSQLSKESSENLKKEISRLTEQTSRLNSDIEEKDKQYREATKELRSWKANYETECKRLNEIIPVLETKQLKKQIHELQEQIRALVPKLEDNNQGLARLGKDVYNTKTKTMFPQGEMKQRDMIIE
ncbi:hypothetical protein IL306_009225, partial [Fusarium sp. DS 682]